MKTISITIALITIIGASLILYNGLKNKVETPELPAKQPEPTGSPNSNTENASANAETTADNRMQAPDFNVTDASDSNVKLSDMLGKPVVLNFWASWCPPCKSEMPEFNKVYEELGSDVHFMMIDVVDGVRETREKGARYISDEGFSFPVYYDINQEAAMQYGIRAFPTSIFIDSEGYVVTGAEGAIDESKLRKGIELIMPKEQAKYNKISAEEAKQIIDGDKSFILLDVRTESEYKEKHIEGAILIPDYEITKRAETELADKNALILVYCRSGNRSASAAKALVNMGYTNVYDFGGIISWPY